MDTSADEAAFFARLSSDLSQIHDEEPTLQRVVDRAVQVVGPCDWWGPFSVHDVSPGRVPLSISGWRFQASSDDGETHVFDVEHDGAHWHLVRVYD